MKGSTRFRTGVTISAVGHVAVLGWGLVSFAAKPHETPAIDSLAVDVISPTEFSQMTAGSRSAKPAEAAKPLVEKVAEPQPVDNEATKVVETKPEILAAADAPNPPAPENKPQPEAKPEPPKPETKAETPPPIPEPRPKVDQIAEALKKEEAKKEEKKPEPKPQAKKPEPKFDPGNIQRRLAMLDKRDPQRRAATGDTLSQTASLGTATGTAPQLTQNELDALRARLRECWTVPVGVAEARDLHVLVRIQFRRDGSLATEPRLLNNSGHPAFQVAAESALRAVRKCAPYSFMPPAKYEAWKDVEVMFDPRDMFRG